MNVVNLRLLTKEDWISVSRIYAEGIATGIATFETEVPSWNAWHKKFVKDCRLIAEINNEVIGFAMLSLMSKRKVYKGVAEVSIYVSESYRGKGIGKNLLEGLIVESENIGFWTLQAGIFIENKASITLHKRCGFRVVGIREKIGHLNGIWHDNVLLERRTKHISK
jgi:phosphinothricin acetyltransferase